MFSTNDIYTYTFSTHAMICICKVMLNFIQQEPLTLLLAFINYFLTRYHKLTLPTFYLPGV